VRVLGLEEVGHASARDAVGSANVDGVHEVELFEGGVEGAGEGDGGSVVDDNVDAAEFVNGLLDGGCDLSLIADVDDAREALAAGSMDFLCGGVDGTRQFWVGLCRLCCGGMRGRRGGEWRAPKYLR
jgi:hypothetical protein